jgi:hypothetical protein
MSAGVMSVKKLIWPKGNAGILAERLGGSSPAIRTHVQ